MFEQVCVSGGGSGDEAGGGRVTGSSGALSGSDGTQGHVFLIVSLIMDIICSLSY